MSDRLDKTFWEDRWHQVYARQAAEVRDKPPSPWLVAEAADLTPGTALDAGCGHGTDAIWLASLGWRVTAVDFATNALRHARERSETLGADIAARIDWTQADLTTWTPTAEHFDLVCAHYLHGVDHRDALFRRLAASVAPSGTLLIVGHHPLDRRLAGPQAPPPEIYFTAEEIAPILTPDRWQNVVAETRTRPDTDHNGHQITLHDAVLRARKRP